MHVHTSSCASCLSLQLHVGVTGICSLQTWRGGSLPDWSVFSSLFDLFILFKVEAINMLYIGSIFIYVLVVFMLIDRCLIVFTWFKTKTLRWSEKLSMTDKALLLEKQGW